MNRSHASNDTCLWLRNLRQCLNLTGMGHTQFKNSSFMLRLQLEKLQWQSEMVIEVSFRLQHAIFLCEEVRGNLFRGRLPCRAGDGNQLLAPQSPDRCGQSLQGDESVIHPQQSTRQVQRRYSRFAHDRSQSAARECGFDIVVSIKALAFHSEEQFAGLNGT